MEVSSRWGAKRSALPLREYDVARVDQRIEPSLDPWAAVEQLRSLARKAFGRFGLPSSNGIHRPHAALDRTL